MRLFRLAVIVVGMIVATGGLPAHAIMGCMRDIDLLADQAELVVAFSVDEVRMTKLASCPQFALAQGLLHSRCGDVAEIHGKPVKSLKGHVNAGSPIHVSLDGPLALNCDDRPTAREFVEGLRGSQVILFLGSDAKSYWTLYGPDSIYPGTYEATVRTALDTSGLTLSLNLESPSTARGTVVALSHTITNEADKLFRGCIGSQHSWVFVTDQRWTVDRPDATLAPRCSLELDLAPGASTTWVRDVFVPADTPTGTATIRASVQILEPYECDQQPCGRAFVTAAAGPLEITAALERPTK